RFPYDDLYFAHRWRQGTSSSARRRFRPTERKSLLPTAKARNNCGSKPLDQEQPKTVEDSEGDTDPLWSPDSKVLAFGARHDTASRADAGSSLRRRAHRDL